MGAYQLKKNHDIYNYVLIVVLVKNSIKAGQKTLLT